MKRFKIEQTYLLENSEGCVDENELLGLDRILRTDRPTILDSCKQTNTHTHGSINKGVSFEEEIKNP